MKIIATLGGIMLIYFGMALFVLSPIFACVDEVACGFFVDSGLLSLLGFFICLVIFMVLRKMESNRNRTRMNKYEDGQDKN